MKAISGLGVLTDNMSTHERSFVEGFEWGFKSGYIAGMQDGYAQGYDDATRAALNNKEAEF
jgi:hypothetical protein